MANKTFSGTPLYDDMVKTIDDAYRYDPGESITDPRERLKYYARQAQNVEAERKAMAVRERATREIKKAEYGY